MATKTISIDLDAYKRLKTAKRRDESFSQVIKRVVPKPFDVDQWLASIKRDPISERAAKAIEDRIDARRRPSRRER